MKSWFTLLAAVLLVFGAVACAREEVPTAATETEIAGTTNPQDLNPITAQTWVDDVTIGHELGPDGKIPAGRTGDDFAPGQPIHIAMEIGDAPPASAVKLVWYGPGETRVGEETKNVVAGQNYLNFSASDTASWAKGDYRAEVWVGDEKVNTQQFQIVDAAKAGK